MKEKIFRKLSKTIGPMAASTLFNLIEQLGEDNTPIVEYNDELFWFHPKQRIIIKNLGVSKPVYYKLLSILADNGYISKVIEKKRMIVKIHFEKINEVLVGSEE